MNYTLIPITNNTVEGIKVGWLSQLKALLGEDGAYFGIAALTEWLISAKKLSKKSRIIYGKFALKVMVFLWQ